MFSIRIVKIPKLNSKGWKTLEENQYNNDPKGNVSVANNVKIQMNIISIRSKYFSIGVILDILIVYRMFNKNLFKLKVVC